MRAQAGSRTPSTRSSVAIHLESASAPIALSWLGHLKAKVGDRDGATSVLNRLTETARTQWVAPMAEAWVLAGLGSLDGALECVNRAVDQRDAWLVYMDADPRLGPLRDGPGLASLRPAVGPWLE
jgi:Flp pilus assembly protein TadD